LEVRIRGEIIDTSINYRKRKTVQLSLSSEGTLVVSAPAELNEKAVLDIVKKHENWIINKLESFRQNNIHSEEIKKNEQLFLGRRLEIKFSEEKKIPKVKIELNGDFLFFLFNPSIPQDLRKNMFEKYIHEWFLNYARSEFDRRLKVLSVKTGLYYKTWRLKDQKTKWGSCSSKKNISLNWRLVMAPETVIDYVIIHELCHLRYMNHSKDFWKFVGTIYPNYLSSKEWLKKNGHRMKINL